MYTPQLESVSSSKVGQSARGDRGSEQAQGATSRMLVSGASLCGPEAGQGHEVPDSRHGCKNRLLELGAEMPTPTFQS